VGSKLSCSSRIDEFRVQAESYPQDSIST
jgi:hypothetical protein